MLDFPSLLQAPNGGAESIAQPLVGHLLGNARIVLGEGKFHYVLERRSRSKQGLIGLARVAGNGRPGDHKHHEEGQRLFGQVHNWFPRMVD